MVCSNLFAKIFNSGGGGCIRTCACNRIHFDGSEYGGWDWEEGELEELQENSKKNPDRYIEHGETVWTLDLGGLEVVYGCHCEIAEKYERFIIEASEEIAEYLNRKADLDIKAAEKIKVKKYELCF